MTFDLIKFEPILKHDGKRWNDKPKNSPSIFIVDNSDISSVLSQNTDEKKVLIVINHDLFRKYFENIFIQQNILSNEIQLPNEIRQISNHRLRNFTYEFESIKLIGKGGFGKVYSAVNKADLQTYAVKRIIFDTNNIQKDFCNEILREFRILAQLNHENILNYKAAWFEMITDDGGLIEMNTLVQYDTSNDYISQEACSTDSRYDKSETSVSPYNSTNPDYNDEGIVFAYSSISGNSLNSTELSSQSYASKVKVSKMLCNQTNPSKMVLYIQTELCQWTLRDWIDERNKSPSKLDAKDYLNSRSLCRQFLTGIAYLHFQKIIHRDLKPANIFLRTHFRCRSESDLQLRIGDFGLAKQFHDDCDDNSMARQKLTANVGTALYMAPEICNEKRKRVLYNHKSDLYSAGIILLELMMKFRTTSGLIHTINNLKNGIMDKDLHDIWPVEAKYIMNLLSKSPDSRTEADFIINKTHCFQESFVMRGGQEQLKLLMEEINVLQKENEYLRNTNSTHVGAISNLEQQNKSLLEELQKLRLFLRGN